MPSSSPIPHEALIRFGSFAAMYCLMLFMEWRFPRRAPTQPKTRRLAANLGVVALSSSLVWLVFPILPVGAALWAERAGFGLMNLVPMPFWAKLALTVLLLDLAVWAQHLAAHRVRLFWLVHRMHHVDKDIDASTGVRFHPIEIALSMVWKLLLVVLLGAPALGVVIFEIVLNGTAVFNHANLALPLGLDRWLRLVLVTPDMHRVHHSTNPREFNHNLGFNFPWWDRIFRTYTAQPGQGHLDMKIGLNIFRDPKYQRLDQMLAIPFR